SDLIAISASLLVTLAGRTAKAACAILVLAVFLAYVLAPAARVLRQMALRRRRHLTPLAALGIIYMGTGLVLLATRVALGERLLGQVGQFTSNMPSQVGLAIQLTSSLERWQRWFGWSGTSSSRLEAAALALSDWVRLHVAEVLVDAIDYLWLGPWMVLVPVLSFLLLTQFGAFRRSTIRVLPRGHLRWRGLEFLEQVNGVLAGYVRAQVVSAGIVTVICVVGYAILRVPYALLLGAATGLLEFVPLLGPIAVALLLAGLVQGRHLLVVLIFLVGVRVFQDTVVYPRLMGRQVHLPPVAVLAAVWAGATIGGILGVLLAVPVVAVGAVAFRQVRDYREIQHLLARAEEERALACDPPNPT
ncbi:MAG: AI-2E family transporter, partial [Vicinamibacterales bacterium]